MALKFFDVNVYVGNRADDRYNLCISVEKLLEKMKAVNIEKAIIYHTTQRYGHPVLGNETLINLISNNPNLYGILTGLPFQTDEIQRFDFKKLKAKKIVGFTFFPKRHNYLLNRIVIGDFLSELEARRFPVFLDIMSGYAVSFPDVYSLLSDFPDLTCILCNLGVWNTDRYTWPLLEKFSNVYLECSLLSLGEGALEETVKRFGAERIVFGTGYPERYMEAPILQLTHAEITEEDKEKIAYKNIERVIGKIKYE